MPDQLEKSIQKLLNEAMTSRQPTGRPQSKKMYAQNAVIHELGCDPAGLNHYLIAADVEGQRKNYRTIELPSGDPQSDHPQAVRTVHEVIVRWYRKSHRWEKTKLPNDLEVEPSIQQVIDEDTFLDRISQSKGAARRGLICDAETFKFNQAQRERIRPILWEYIIECRDSKDPDDLIAVGSAIRKYVSMLDVAGLGELAPLLESGHRAPLSPDLQLELAKMVYRKFEASPPTRPEPHPQLSRQLWEIAQAYLNPHVLLHDKFATVASLSIEAVVAMRSASSDEAVKAAFGLPYKWFGEMVGDNLQRLAQRWRPKNAEAAAWCAGLLPT